MTSPNYPHNLEYPPSPPISFIISPTIQTHHFPPDLPKFSLICPHKPTLHYNHYPQTTVLSTRQLSNHCPGPCSNLNRKPGNCTPARPFKLISLFTCHPPKRGVNTQGHRCRFELRWWVCGLKQGYD